MIIKIEIIQEDEQGEKSVVCFSGDELTSAISEAVLYLLDKQQKGMVV